MSLEHDVGNDSPYSATGGLSLGTSTNSTFAKALLREISNLGRIAVALYPGMRICQVSFEALSSPVSQGYGVKRAAKYQGQASATASRLYEDVEFRQRG